MFITVTVPYGTSVVVEIANDREFSNFMDIMKTLLFNDKVTLETNGDQEGLEVLSVSAFRAWLDLFGEVMLKQR